MNISEFVVFLFTWLGLITFVLMVFTGVDLLYQKTKKRRERRREHYAKLDNILFRLDFVESRQKVYFEAPSIVHVWKLNDLEVDITRLKRRVADVELNLKEKGG